MNNEISQGFTKKQITLSLNKSTHIFFLAFILCFILVHPAKATVFNYDLTFDGTNVSVDPGSDTPGGSVFSAGDSFNLNFRASGNSFWRVDGTFANQFAPFTFLLEESGDRTGNVNSIFSLDGSQTEQIIETNVFQSEIHMGAQFWALGTGLEFDAVSMTYELLTSTATTTINTLADIFEGFGQPDSPFFRSQAISFVSNVPSSQVPLPPTLLLIFLGLGLMRLQKKRS